MDDNMSSNVISGKIEKGEGLGSKISYPTINVVLDKDEELEGVYVCKVRFTGDSERGDVFGAGYVGEKKSLPDGKFVCEVNLFEEVGDLYGLEVEIELLEKIRDVQKVKNLEELRSLISEDVKKSKEWLLKN
ncbi:hypothetical protein HOG17_05070 [Candidatus Peregrinibacteria bacterium]|nr:hypothetical protein [Candidatus Peregrinibacteria bacterium]